MIQKGDRILFEATVLETRDLGNIVLRVGDRTFTASADAIERARFLATPPAAAPTGKAKGKKR